MSFYTGTQTEVLFSNGFAYPAANASSSTAQSLIAGASGKFQEAVFPGLFFQSGRTGQVASVDFALLITGQASATTATITAGLATSSNNVSGTTLVASSAFTVTSWSSGSAVGKILISCFGAGYGTSSVSTNLWSSLSLNGFGNALAVTAAGGPTNVTTIDASVNQWLYLTVTFSTASATNSATLQQLIVNGLN